jgi:CRP-like cAMP-binding protein
VHTGVSERIVDAAAAFSANLRSPNLRRAQAAFGLVWAGDWAATVAVGVIAFRDGGATAIGLVGIARMVPAAIVAPLAATIADRGRREWVLAGVGAARGICLGAAAAVSAAGGPTVLVYLALVVATVAQTLFRPAHSALLPSLCATPAELTSANVVRGLLDSTATLIGPLVAAVLLQVSGPGAVLGSAAAASTLAAMLAMTLRYEAPPRLVGIRSKALFGQAVEGIRAIAADRALTLLTALTTLQTFTRGALTVFSVVIAIDLLGGSAAGVGVLVSAVGAGAIVGSLSVALLVGRGGLARWFGTGVALWGAPLAVIGLLPHWWAVIMLLAVVGIGNALVDVGVFTLIARLADDTVLARVFAAFEGSLTLGAAAGAIVAPALISALGLRGALVVCGALAPASVFVSWRALRALDRRMHVRDGDVALLQRIPMLHPLPEATIEQLAARLGRAQLPAGASAFEQGDAGDEFYVIERGSAEVISDGYPVRALEAGDGFGEIALIRECPRTATVRATTSLVLRTLNRTVFVAAVAGYSPSARAVHHVITGHLSNFTPASLAESGTESSADRPHGHRDLSGG